MRGFLESALGIMLREGKRRKQDQAEGAWAQVVVELFYLPAPVPGSYLWMVHVQHLGSKPDIDTQPGYPMLTFVQMATFLLRLPGKALFKSSV